MPQLNYKWRAEKYWRRLQFEGKTITIQQAVDLLFCKHKLNPEITNLKIRNAYNHRKYHDPQEALLPNTGLELIRVPGPFNKPRRKRCIQK